MRKIATLLLLSIFLVHVATAQVPSYIPTTGLIGWYPFNSNADNEYGPLWDGRVFEATLTTDRNGTANSAYYFDGINDHITIDTAFFTTSWNNYTIACWMNLQTQTNTNNGNQSHIVFNTIPHHGVALSYNWGNSNKYDMWVDSNNSMDWEVLEFGRSSSSVLASTWQHVAMVREDTVYSFYVNGVMDTSFVRYGAIPVRYYKFQFGANDTMESGEAFWGKLDDYGIWTRALSDCEIEKMYDGTSSPIITTHPADVTVPVGASATFTTAMSGTGISYQWQVNTGTGFVPVPAAVPYSGVYTPTLTVSPVTAAMNGYKYRCVLSSETVCTYTSTDATLTVGAVSVSGVAEATGFLVVPNPTNGNVLITGCALEGAWVYDSMGRLVMQATDNTLSFSGLPNGVYFLKIMDDKHLIHYTRVIKQ